MLIRKYAEKLVRFNKRQLIFILLLVLAVGQLGFFAIGPGLMAAKSATVCLAEAAVYEQIAGEIIIAQLAIDQIVDVLEEEQDEAGQDWYKISWEENDEEQTGWLKAESIQLEPVARSLMTTAANNTDNFTAWLTEQKFPQSYWPALEALHEKYPQWIFKSVATNLSFADAVQHHSAPGAVLISNKYYDDAYLSLEPNAYNWYTDTWTPYDGSSWMICNKATVEYYMDPRNFLTERDIFQFESLNYQGAVHDEAGVEKILQKSFMANTSFCYLDSQSGEEKSMTYAAAFVEAGKFSNVSPYHLASRSLIEVSSSGSPSVSGKFSEALEANNLPVITDYDGYYNFYNIGASASTETLGNVRNGLEYAKFGADRKPEQTATDIQRLIPWDNPYKSIVGGSDVIGANYINANKTNPKYADQNTLYLQKFNVGYLSTSGFQRRYWHLYMGNIVAPTVEGGKIYDAYKARDDLDKPITFLIPIYSNLPASCPKPAETGNPNNWLKTLAIKDFPLTPSFDAAVTDGYSLIVDHTVTDINLTAVPVNSKAQVAGAGEIELKTGENILKVTVTAVNGNKRTYTITIFREKHPDDMPPAKFQSDKLQIIESEQEGEANLISGLNPADNGNTVEKILQDLKIADDYTVKVVDKDNKPVTALVGTGHKIQIHYLNEIFNEYTVLLFGDANGDGQINAIDVTMIIRNMQGTLAFSEIITKVTDLNHDGRINAIDATMAIHHFQGRIVLDQ